MAARSRQGASGANVGCFNEGSSGCGAGAAAGAAVVEGLSPGALGATRSVLAALGATALGDGAGALDSTSTAETAPFTPTPGLEPGVIAGDVAGAETDGATENPRRARIAATVIAIAPAAPTATPRRGAPLVGGACVVVTGAPEMPIEGV